MKSVSKGVILTYILLAFAIIEGLVLIYDFLRPAPQNVVLAQTEIEVAARDMSVPPLLFEQHSAQKVAQQLDEFVADYFNKQTMLQQIEHYATSADNTVPNESTMPIVATNDKAAKQDVAPLPKNKKYIAIVIDDLGVSPQYTQAIINLKKPLTAAFLPYAPASKVQVEQAKAAGFEVMLHVPMMPHQRAALAPVTLAPEMDKATVQKHLRDFLAYFDGTGMTGINNHMGSEFTENAQSLGYVMEILKEKGLFFLDSKTTGKSAVKSVAAEYGVPYIARDVFLDNENNYSYIMGQLHQAEQIATKHGVAVAIGHPHSETVKALSEWLKTVEDRGFVLVHISDLLK